MVLFIIREAGVGISVLGDLLSLQLVSVASRRAILLRASAVANALQVSGSDSTWSVIQIRQAVLASAARGGTESVY